MIYELKKESGLSVRMRPFVKEDMTDIYCSWFHDVDVTMHNSHGLFPMTKTRMDEFLDDIENGRRIVWAIKVNEKHTLPGINDIRIEKLIGNCSLQSINYHNRSAEFAIVIGDKDYWGKGIATFALKSSIHHAFNVMGLHRVWTGTSEYNMGMQRTCEKAGMSKEGVFKQGMWCRGKFVDIHAYGIINKEA